MTTLAIVFGLWFLASAVVGFACCRAAGRADEHDRLHDIAPRAVARPAPLNQQRRGVMPIDRGREITAS
jgi:hypothetical protein